MITEDYVSFETANLLKEKGFDWECIGYYVDDEPDDVYHSLCGETNSTWESRCCSAPTLQMAMKWLREVHDVYIDISIYVITVDILKYNINVYYKKQFHLKLANQFCSLHFYHHGIQIYLHFLKHQLSQM